MKLTVKVSDNIDANTAKQIENYFNGMTDAQKQHVVSSKDSFSYWLNNRAPHIYRKVASYIDEIWRQVEQVLEDVLIGVTKGAAAVVFAPIVGVIEGVAEGFENGLEAGVKKGFKAMGNFLDDLLS